MGKIIDFFKKLFGIKAEETKLTPVSSTPAPNFSTPTISAPATIFTTPTTSLNGSASKEIIVSNPVATIKFTEVDYTATTKKKEPKKLVAKTLVKKPVAKTPVKKPVAKKAPTKKTNNKNKK